MKKTLIANWAMVESIWRIGFLIVERRQKENREAMIYSTINDGKTIAGGGEIPWTRGE